MKQFIERDYTRTESDDYKLNVWDRTKVDNEALPIYEDEKIIGWIIQPRYE